MGAREGAGGEEHQRNVGRHDSADPFGQLCQCLDATNNLSGIQSRIGDQGGSMLCTREDAAALQALMAMAIPQRIKAVCIDVNSRADRFAWVDAHALAEALGIEDARSPGNDWSFETRADDLTLEEYASEMGISPYSALLDWLTPTPQRAKTLAEKALQMDNDEIDDFSFLTTEEHDIIKAVINEEMFERNMSNGMGCYATIMLGENVGPDVDERLHFEALIEDDGICCILKTPYAIRDEEPTRPGIISKYH